VCKLKIQTADDNQGDENIVLSKNKFDRVGSCPSSVGSREFSLILIRFRIVGNLRFLSHSEMLRVFQRAFVRAGLQIQYTQGFNPRVKLSLPLPRPVGVETEEDLLYVRVSNSAIDIDSFSGQLKHQLPIGFEIIGVEIVEKGVSYQPYLATYILTVKSSVFVKTGKNIKAAIKRIMESESLEVERYVEGKKSKSKTVDVRDFLKSVELKDKRVKVEYNISPRGSIRVDEIIKLLGIETEHLAEPVRRTNVQWRRN